MGGISGTALGQAIRAARDARGWTQTQLADAVGVKQTAVSQWETGGRTMDVPTLRAVERALGVSFGGIGPDADTAFRLGYAMRELDEIREIGERLAEKAKAAAAKLGGGALMPASASAVDGETAESEALALSAAQARARRKPRKRRRRAS